MRSCVDVSRSQKAGDMSRQISIITLVVNYFVLFVVSRAIKQLVRRTHYLQLAPAYSALATVRVGIHYDHLTGPTASIVRGTSL